jgi:prepilin-type N-terminal cleavage/methylation domain-containing protein
MRLDRLPTMGDRLQTATALRKVRLSWYSYDQNEGFTLIELMIAVAIIGALSRRIGHTIILTVDHQGVTKANTKGNLVGACASALGLSITGDMAKAGIRHP